MFVSVQLRIEFRANPEFFLILLWTTRPCDFRGLHFKTAGSTKYMWSTDKVFNFVIIIIVSFQFQRIRSCSWKVTIVTQCMTSPPHTCPNFRIGAKPWCVQSQNGVNLGIEKISAALSGREGKDLNVGRGILSHNGLFTIGVDYYEDTRTLGLIDHWLVLTDVS